MAQTLVHFIEYWFSTGFRRQQWNGLSIVWRLNRNKITSVMESCAQFTKTVLRVTLARCRKVMCASDIAIR